jgi:transposase-like protein
MSKRPRRNHSPAFKAKVALAVVRGEKTLAELAQQYDVYPSLINQWRARLLEGAADVFGAETDLAIMRRIDELHSLYPFAGSRMLRDLLR